MKILVTAGNTQTPIDLVRCITNIFSGRTGAAIALEACSRGHSVRLLTSHPEVVAELRQRSGEFRPEVFGYRTFHELARLLEEEVRTGGFDAIVHCAAVSDYAAAGVYAPATGTTFDPARQLWHGGPGGPRLVDAQAGKITSRHGELWLRLTPTPKLVDQIRKSWGFRGLLVKFKLEVGVDEEQLRVLAEPARIQSAADLLVANTLEGKNVWALLGPIQGAYQRVSRAQLPLRLLDALENLQAKPESP
jgi:phosphopantothenoylcysteine synthetase/decarboxylase